MTRREFISLSTAASASALIPKSAAGQAAPARRPQPKTPRWRGFNLTEMTGGRRGSPYRESDFQWMADWGFNFARLPLSYWQWSSPRDWMTIDPDALKPLDQALEFGKQYGIHLCMGFHRIPGYCVSGRDLEPFQLFDSPKESMQR